MNEDYPWLTFLLQTSDALFPTGSYAHSLGFEESVRLGLISNEATLRQFLFDQIIPAQREQELPYLRFAHLAACANDLGELCQVDAEVSAWKLALETRNASIQLGVRRLTALREIVDSPLLEEYGTHVTQGTVCGHHITVCGLQAAVERVPQKAALLTFFYQSVAAVCGAAMKLIRIGQSGCQRVLREAGATACTVVASSLAVQRRQVGWFNPLLEIASMRHERAEERLFIS